MPARSLAGALDSTLVACDTAPTFLGAKRSTSACCVLTFSCRSRIFSARSSCLALPRGSFAAFMAASCFSIAFKRSVAKPYACTRSTSASNCSCSATLAFLPLTVVWPVFLSVRRSFVAAPVVTSIRLIPSRFERTPVSTCNSRLYRANVLARSLMVSADSGFFVLGLTVCFASSSWFLMLATSLSMRLSMSCVTSGSPDSSTRALFSAANFRALAFS